jgi:hypothetical protein
MPQVEVAASRGFLVVGSSLYKVPHGEFFNAIQDRAFARLRICSVTAWANKEIEELPFFKRRDPTDYLKLTVYLDNAVAGALNVVTHFHYLAQKVHMEAAQRQVRLFIRRRSKARTLAFCMAMHPRIGEASTVRPLMPPDALRYLLVEHGILCYVGQ